MGGHRIEITPTDGIPMVFTEGRSYVDRAASAFRRVMHRSPEAVLVEPSGKRTDVAEYLAQHA